MLLSWTALELRVSAVVSWNKAPPNFWWSADSNDTVSMDHHIMSRDHTHTSSDPLSNNMISAASQDGQQQFQAPPLSVQQTEPVPLPYLQQWPSSCWRSQSQRCWRQPRSHLSEENINQQLLDSWHNSHASGRYAVHMSLSEVCVGARNHTLVTEKSSFST